MSHLPLVDPATATGPARDLLAAVHRNLGVTPNMTRAMANSPALLKGYLELSGALAAGALPLATRERLALALAEGNACSYCLSAHTYLSEHAAKLDGDDIAAARYAESADPVAAAALTLAAAINRTRGDIGAADLAEPAGGRASRAPRSGAHAGHLLLVGSYPGRRRPRPRRRTTTFGAVPPTHAETEGNHARCGAVAVPGEVDAR